MRVTVLVGVILGEADTLGVRGGVDDTLGLKLELGDNDWLAVRDCS